MTPDRPEDDPFDESSENSVLAATGSIDTSKIGILGGATEQVSVSLPVPSDDDDLDDDDVIGDEVSFGEAFPISSSFDPPAFPAEPTFAIATEPAHISETESVSPALRPLRSAYTPISQPPIGRIRKPTANTSAELNSWAVRSPAGKKAWAK